MADVERVKRNIGRMIDQGAPESDIDAYVSSEGMTVAQLQGPSSYLDALKGGAASTVRGFTRDALALPSIPADLINEGMYRVKSLFDPEAQRSERTLRIVDKLLTRLGLPEGTSPVSERVAGAVSGALTGMGLAGQGAKLGAITPGSAAEAAQMMTKGPISQVAGATTGAVAAEKAQEAGIDSPLAQLGIELAGNVAGGMAARPLDVRAGLLDPQTGTRTERALARELDQEGKLGVGVRNTARAKNQGIDITPMEATDSSKLRSAGKKAISEAGDPAQIDAFNLKRAEQSESAIKEFLKKVAPETSTEKAGAVGRATAEGVEEVVRAKRQAASAPMYEKAFNEPPSKLPREVKKIVTTWQDNPGFQEVWEKAGAKIAAFPASHPDRNVKNPQLMQLHHAKILIGDALRAHKAGQETGLKNIGSLGDKKWTEELDTVLDAYSPKDPKTGRPYYRDAAETFAALSPRVEQVKEGSVGSLAGTEDVALSQAPKKFFDVNKGPLQVSQAFKDLRGKDPQAADIFLRGYLQDALDDASKLSNQPEKVAKARVGKQWRDMVLKIPNKHREMLKASMTGKQYKQFVELEEVLDMTSKAPVAGSEAEYLSAAQKMGDLGVDVIAAGQSALGVKRFVINLMDRLYTGRHNKEIAALMFDKDGMAKIAAARNKDPITKRLVLASVIRAQANKEQE